MCRQSRGKRGERREGRPRRRRRPGARKRPPSRRGLVSSLARFPLPLSHVSRQGTGARGPRVKKFVDDSGKNERNNKKVEGPWSWSLSGLGRGGRGTGCHGPSLSWYWKGLRWGLGGGEGEEDIAQALLLYHVITMRGVVFKRRPSPEQEKKEPPSLCGLRRRLSPLPAAATGAAARSARHTGARGGGGGRRGEVGHEEGRERSNGRARRPSRSGSGGVWRGWATGRCSFLGVGRGVEVVVFCFWGWGWRRSTRTQARVAMCCVERAQDCRQGRAPAFRGGGKGASRRRGGEKKERRQAVGGEEGSKPTVVLVVGGGDGVDGAHVRF